MQKKFQPPTPMISPPKWRKNNCRFFFKNRQFHPLAGEIGQKFFHLNTFQTKVHWKYAKRKNPFFDPIDLEKLSNFFEKKWDFCILGVHPTEGWVQPKFKMAYMCSKNVANIDQSICNMWYTKIWAPRASKDGKTGRSKNFSKFVKNIFAIFPLNHITSYVF